MTMKMSCNDAAKYCSIICSQPLIYAVHENTDNHSTD